MPQVRYWGGAKAMAGTSAEQVSGDTLSMVLTEVQRAHAGIGRLLTAGVLLVDGEQANPDMDRMVSPSTVVEILPPCAGG